MANPKKQSDLLRAYLVVGEDELKRQHILARLRQRLEKLGDLSFNSESFKGEDCTGEEIVAAANTLPFASDVRLVEVHDVELLKKADSELVVDYLKAPCPSTVLALEANKLAKNTRLYKAVAALGAGAVIDCAPPARKDFTAHVRKAAAVKGIALSPGAAAALVDLVGANTVAIDAELDKLALSHRGTDPVNESEVLSMVSRTAEIKPWEFTDAFSGRNAQRCLYLLHRMESVSPHALLSMCITRIRELITTKALGRRGEGGRLASVLKMPEWRVKNHRTWAKNFSMDELIAALRSARDAEQAMKSGTDPDEAFLRWLLSVCRRS